MFSANGKAEIRKHIINYLYAYSQSSNSIYFNIYKTKPHHWIYSMT